MTRQTSIDAYNQIKEENLLGKLQFKVYDALYQYGPATQQEIWNKCFKDTQARNIMPRFAELQKMGVVFSKEHRACTITGRNCMVWDVTDRLPQEVEKIKSKDQIIKELIQENSNLKKELARIKFENGVLF